MMQPKSLNMEKPGTENTRLYSTPGPFYQKLIKLFQFKGIPLMIFEVA